MQTTSAAVTVPVLLSGMTVNAMAKSSIFNAINDDSDRVLVLIQLNGGNDGLSMLMPINQYDNLANARANIIIPENNYLTIDNDLGLHPVMTGMKGLYDEGKMTIVQSVGYPNQNRSHFRSSDIWTSGSPAQESWTTGWLGRNFQADQPDFPEGYPNSDNPDPFAITVGAGVSETCQGTSANFSLAISDPFNLNPLAVGGEDVVPDTPYGDELSFLRTVIEQTNAYGDVITDAANLGTNMAAYPEDNRLAQQLKSVALLINGGLQTKVYVVALGGFDTHADQTVGDQPGVGVHSNLLKVLSDAVAAFQEDLKLLGLEKRVVGMTFSEFGRRILSNNSLGTDHGDAAPLMVFGNCINPGIVGDNPEIPTNPAIGEAVPMQYDFRNVYGSVLMDWFEVPEDDVKNLLFQEFQYLPILDVCLTDATVDLEDLTSIDTKAYPNPFTHKTTISFNCETEHVRLSVFNSFGQQMELLINKRLPAGDHEIQFDGSALPAGNYYYHLELGGGRQKTKMMAIAR